MWVMLGGQFDDDCAICNSCDDEGAYRAASSGEAPRTTTGKEHPIETLEDRISKLSAAVLRISASLDLETVLREIVDSARELTGAPFGLITTVDDAGQPAGPWSPPA